MVKGRPRSLALLTRTLFCSTQATPFNSGGRFKIMKPMLQFTNLPSSRVEERPRRRRRKINTPPHPKVRAVTLGRVSDQDPAVIRVNRDEDEGVAMVEDVKWVSKPLLK